MVFLVDDDAGVLKALSRVCERGAMTSVFTSPEVSTITMPRFPVVLLTRPAGLDGIELQQARPQEGLIGRSSSSPKGDSTSVRAMKQAPSIS